jgi:L-fuconolactonase
MRVLRRDFLMKDLCSALKEARVDGTVAVQARQTIEETRWLLELAQGASPIWGVVGWLPLADDTLESLLEHFASEPRLKGLRHVVQAEPAGFLDGDNFNRGVRALRGTGLVYDVLILARQLEEATRFVDRHPDQPFVLDHIAKPEIRIGEMERWSAGVREMARRDHVCCKISGMVTEADPLRWTEEELAPYFDVVLETFGPERLMIGTDWPMLTVGCTYGDWWRIVESWIAPLTASEQAQILGGTASRTYRLRASDTAGTIQRQGVSQ